MKKLKALFGGIAAFGILASLVALGNPPTNLSTTTALRAEIVEVDEGTSLIDSFFPEKGVFDEEVYLIISNLEGLAEGSEVFFGDTKAEIEISGENGNGGTTIVVKVPKLTEVGGYPIRVVTPEEEFASVEFFELTAASEPPEVEDLPDEVESDLSGEDLLPLSPIEDLYDPETPTATIEMPTNTIAAPQNLTASSTPAGIELSWQAPINEVVSSYRIYYGSQSGKYIHLIETRNLVELLGKNLESGKIYFFAVSAINTMGVEGLVSDEISAIFNGVNTTPATTIFHASAPKPAILSEEGPAETFLIAILAALGTTTFFFRRKLWARK